MSSRLSQAKVTELSMLNQLKKNKQTNKTELNSIEFSTLLSTKQVHFKTTASKTTTRAENRQRRKKTNKQNQRKVNLSQSTIWTQKDLKVVQSWRHQNQPELCSTNIKSTEKHE